MGSVEPTDSDVNLGSRWEREVSLEFRLIRGRIELVGNGGPVEFVLSMIREENLNERPGHPVRLFRFLSPGVGCGESQC